MATWTHFTAYLDGTRPLKHEERDELYDQLDALLTGGCSGAGYSLHAADQAAIKGSNLITDYTSLNGPGGNQKGTLQAMAAAASTAFVNYSSAVTTALSGEGITAAERDAIIAARVDDHRLWNYYRRLIDALACCVEPAFTNSLATAGTKDEGFVFTLTASGTAPKTFGATGLPAGLSLNTSTGLISGTPSATGTSNVTITVTNACGEDTETLVITINNPLPPPCSFLGASSFVSSSTIGECLDESFDVTGEFPALTNILVEYGGDNISFVVQANGSTVFSSGCMASFTEGSAFVNIPAGTTVLRIIVQCRCAGGESGSSAAITLECP